MPNTIPSGQLIKLLHDRLERHANNTLRGKDCGETGYLRNAG